MDKSEMLDLLKLLSALESWSFSVKAMLPDYLHEKLANTVEFLSAEILDEGEKKSPEPVTARG